MYLVENIANTAPLSLCITMHITSIDAISGEMLVSGLVVRVGEKPLLLLWLA